MENEIDAVWVFSGGGLLPMAIFSSRERAEFWIATRRVSGTLMRFPLDLSVYDWAILHGAFEPRREQHFTLEYQQHFTTGALERYHYEHGTRA